MLAFPGPGIFDDRRYASGLLSLILGGGMASRLFLEVRERRGLTYGIDAGESAYSDAGLWSVDWQCAPGAAAAESSTLVRASLLEVAEHGVERGRTGAGQGPAARPDGASFEGPSSRMSRLGDHRGTRRPADPDEILGRFDAVTAEEVQAGGAELFGRPPVLGVVGPKLPTRRVEALIGRW